jgi:hypothetical protein
MSVAAALVRIPPAPSRHLRRCAAELSVAGRRRGRNGSAAVGSAAFARSSGANRLPPTTPAARSDRSAGPQKEAQPAAAAACCCCYAMVR